MAKSLSLYAWFILVLNLWTGQILMLKAFTTKSDPDVALNFGSSLHIITAVADTNESNTSELGENIILTTSPVPFVQAQRFEDLNHDDKENNTPEETVDVLAYETSVDRDTSTPAIPSDFLIDSLSTLSPENIDIIVEDHLSPNKVYDFGFAPASPEAQSLEDLNHDDKENNTPEETADVLTYETSVDRDTSTPATPSDFLVDSLSTVPPENIDIIVEDLSPNTVFEFGFAPASPEVRENEGRSRTHFLWADIELLLSAPTLIPYFRTNIFQASGQYAQGNENLVNNMQFMAERIGDTAHNVGLALHMHMLCIFFGIMIVLPVYVLVLVKKYTKVSLEEQEERSYLYI